MASEVVRIEGLKGVLDTLKQLPPEIVSKNGGPVRGALRKAALVLQREAVANLDKIIAEPNQDGRQESTGLLKANVVTTRGRRNAFKGESYFVRVRRKVYPDAKGKRISTQKVARLLEYGTARRAPLPWLRPAFATKKQEAVNVFTTDINKRLAAILKRLQRANRVKT